MTILSLQQQHSILNIARLSNGLTKYKNMHDWLVMNSSRIWLVIPDLVPLPTGLKVLTPSSAGMTLFWSGPSPLASETWLVIMNIYPYPINTEKTFTQRKIWQVIMWHIKGLQTMMDTWWRHLCGHWRFPLLMLSPRPTGLFWQSVSGSSKEYCI